MNILVTLNEKYIRPLFVMLDSLYAQGPEPVDLYLLYSDVSEESRGQLQRYMAEHGGRFFPIFVDGTAFRDAPVFGYFPKEMYYRFLCGALLPETEERVLYLDPDILIRGDISPLYEMDFQGKALVGIADHAVNHMLSDKKAAIGLPESYDYVNSGVLLFNLEKMRADFSLDRFIGLLEEYRDRTSYPDQDVMNLYFQEDFLLAPRIYNFNTGYGTAWNLLLFVLKLRHDKEDPVIVHYMGKLKPWQLEYYGKYFKEYYRYLKKRLSKEERRRFRLRLYYVARRIWRDRKRRLPRLRRSAEGRQDECT